MNSKTNVLPQIAQQNRDSAILNINNKIRILKEWASKGIPEYIEKGLDRNSDVSVLEYFPKTIRQFNSWDGQRNSDMFQSEMPSLRPNANDTLRKHALLRSEVETLLPLLVLQAESQRLEKRPASIRRLRVELDREKKIRELLENEIIEARRQLRIAQEISEAATVSRNAIAEEFQARVEILTNENSRLREEIFLLRKQHLKPIPTKKA